MPLHADDKTFIGQLHPFDILLAGDGSAFAAAGGGGGDSVPARTSSGNIFPSAGGGGGSVPGGWHPTVLYMIGFVALEIFAVAWISKHL